MKLRTAAFLGCAVFAASAQAGDWTDNWYVLGAVSHSSTSLSRGGLDRQLSDAGATGLSSDDSDNSHYQWRLQLGYHVNDWLALEGGYIDVGKSRYRASYDGGSAEAKWKAGGVDLAALGILPVNDTFSVFGKLGVIDAKVKTNWSASGAPASLSGGHEETRAEPLYGIGGMMKLTDNASLRVEYERINNLGDSAKTGKADADLVSLGLQYRF